MITDYMKTFLTGGSKIRAMFEAGKEMALVYGPENVYDFSVGNPGLNPPQEVYDAIDFINHEMDPHEVHGYPANAGFKSTRKAVAEDLNRRFGDNFGARNIVMTAGAGAAVNIFLKCIIEPGDKLVAFAPYFVEYGSWVRNYYGEIVVVPSNEAGNFEPDAEALKKVLDPKVKAIIINNPNNPTGAVFSKESIERVADVLREAEKEFGHPIYIISDEPYRELIYTDDEFPYIPKIYDNTVIAYSWSKSLSMPGDRIGYIAVCPRSDNAVEMYDALVVANRVCGITNGPNIPQLIVEKCIDARVDLDYYKKNAAELYRIVTEAGFTAVYPKGAFYLWIKSPVPDESEVIEAAKKERILIVSGSSFASPGWLRATFCISHDTILRSEESWKALGKKYFG